MTNDDKHGVSLDCALQAEYSRVYVMTLLPVVIAEAWFCDIGSVCPGISVDA